MKIWVLNPPYFKHFSRPQRSPAVTKSGTVYFPIWLASCTGVLEQEGHTVMLTDAPARNLTLEQTLGLARTFQPDLVVMDTSTPSIENDVEVCRLIKEQQGSLFAVLVGTHVSALAHETLSPHPWIDAVARREYEYTIRDLAKALSGLKPGQSPDDACRDIQGLSFRKGVSIEHNPDRPFITDLDDLPWVSRVYAKHLVVSDYFNPNALFPMITLMTSRGCPFRCRFCVYPQTLTGRQFRFRSIDNVLAEIAWVQKNIPGIKSIFFEDDTLSANKKRCVELARKMIKQKLTIPWTTNSRIDMDLETLTLIKKAGCRSLCVGFESGDQAVLDTMKKGIRQSAMFRFMENAKKAGILIHGCFMVGFPGETVRQIQKTIDLAIQLNPDTAQFYPVMVYPGTDAYEDYKAADWITAARFRDWLTPQGLHNCVVRNETLSSRELVAICDDARRRFYLRPGYFLYKVLQLLKHPSEIRRTLKALRTFYRHLLKGSLA